MAAQASPLPLSPQLVGLLGRAGLRTAGHVGAVFTADMDLVAVERQLRELVGSGVAPALDEFDGWVSELFGFAGMAEERDGRDARRLARTPPDGGRLLSEMLVSTPGLGVSRTPLWSCATET